MYILFEMQKRINPHFDSKHSVRSEKKNDLLNSVVAENKVLKF